MDADWIITAFVLIDTLMERLGHQSDVRAQVPDAEVILIEVVAAKYFPNHHERAVCILRETHCPYCGLEIDRDLNAALNIVAVGLHSLGNQSLVAGHTGVDTCGVPPSGGCQSRTA